MRVVIDGFAGLGMLCAFCFLFLIVVVCTRWVDSRRQDRLVDLRAKLVVTEAERILVDR